MRKDKAQKIANNFYNRIHLKTQQKKQQSKDKLMMAQQHNIFDQVNQSCDQSSLQSSFQLNQNKQDLLKKNQTIDKVLNRLGLKARTVKNKNQQLEMIVGNIVENCVGIVDNQNTLTYDKKYDSLYKDKLTQQPKNISIIVNELTDLQKIQLINNTGIMAIYKFINLFLKKISLLCQSIIQHTLFQTIILIIIILNSVKMALDDPLSTTDSSPGIQKTFIFLYLIEMILKIFALGFFWNPNSYLRDPWNILDFLVATTSVLPLIMTVGFSLSSLRAIRVLRPLKTITKIKSLKMIVSTLFHSFSLVLDSLYILLFVIVVFGIAGTQLFSGILKNRCLVEATGQLTQTLCIDSCSDSGKICVRGIESPNFSISNFDTFLWSILTVFQTITLEGWSSIMVSLQRTYGKIAALYSILIIFFCEYVLLNMTLAILKYKYGQVKGNTIQEQEAEKTQYETEFLKRIGIFQNISKMESEGGLHRYIADDKIFVGSKQFYLRQQGSVTNPFDTHVRNIDINTLKISDKIHSQKLKKEVINLEELKNYGKIQQQKWDNKTLFFQSEIKNENDGDQKQAISLTGKSIKSVQSIDSLSQHRNQPQVNNSIAEDQNQSIQSYGSELSENDQRQDLNGKAYQINKKLGKTLKELDQEIQKTKRNIQKNNQSKPLKKIAEVQQLDKLLSIVESRKQSHQVKFSLQVPEINMEQIEVQRLYQRFNDLGEYKIKRISKNNQLDNIQINHKRVKSQPSNIHNDIKQIIQQKALDIKQLQLVNDLTKKQLRCRIKQKNYLNSIATYEKTRILVSTKIKDQQKKQKQLQANIESLNFNVKYKYEQISNKKRQSALVRHVPKEINGLKIPQFIHQKQKEKLKSQKNRLKSQSNQYLKLLQSHQMEQKIQISQNRLMQLFFKKQKVNIQNKQPEITLQEEYRKIKQSDIYIKQGNIVLVPPVQSELSQSVLQSLNIKPQEYEIYVRGFFGIISVMRKKTLLFINTKIYDNTMLLFVSANTVILALNGIVDTDQTLFTNMNTFFTAVFTIDLFLKIFSYGLQFFGDVMNLFDAFVVSISLVQLATGSGKGNLSALRSVRLLRAFRVLRITRLVRTLNYMRVVMAVISSVINEFVYILMLLGLFIFIYTLLGMQMFAGTTLASSITGVRQHFNDIFNSFFIVFQVLTVQNWNDIETIVITSQAGVYMVIYLISWIFLGNWILLNLIQAILLQGFDKDAEINQQQQELLPIQKQEKDEQSHLQQNSSDDQQNQKDVQQSDLSLLLFRPSNIIRCKVTILIRNPFFEKFIILIIFISSLKLVTDTYVQSGSQFQKLSNNIDIVINLIFMVECLLKIISKGFILGKNAYLKDSWSKLDFFIVCSAIIDMSSNVNLSILKLFRTLRPLRIISRNPDMRIIIASLAESIGGILNVLVIILSVFLMFAILGINLLQDKLNYCNSSPKLQVNNFGPYGVNQTQCELQGGVWTTQFINFDNIINGMLSMYVFSSRENWPYYVYTFFDADTDGPLQNNSQFTYMIFSIVVIFVCSYFFMDLVIGVLFMNFHKAEAKFRPKKLTDKQINWKNLQKIIIHQNPCFELFLKPQGSFRSFFYNIIKWKWFDMFITGCILGNIVAMMIAQDDDSSYKTYVLTQINFVFSLVFILEMLMKLMAYSRYYFLSGWNIFDFFIVCASVIDITAGYIGGGNSTQLLSTLPQIARIFRVMRVTRLLRMFKRFKGLQKLIQTFIFSMPALGKGLSIVFLFFFISSVLASFLFGDIMSDYSGNIDDVRNFQNFHSSFELLFIMTTGQNWYYYMYESSIEGYVTCKDGVDCVSSYNIIFWILFIFLSQKVFMQLFVLIVLDQFEANYINENNPLGIFSLLEEDFRQNWIQCTTKYHSQKIEVKKLVDLIMQLKQPLGLGKAEWMIKYEEELRNNQTYTQENIQASMSELDLKLKKNGAKLIHKMNIIKNRMYLGYHQTFYHFAKLSIASEFIDSANPAQKQILEAIHKESEKALEDMVPEGNLFYFNEAEDVEVDEPLNPIELILFCQMIIKSWHNYSIKFHSQSRKNKKKNQNWNSDCQQSLIQSCSSEVEQAVLQKMTTTKKNQPRKGLIQKSNEDEISYQFRIMPNIIEHYGYERKKAKTKNSVRKSRNSRTSRNSILKIINKKQLFSQK